MKISPDDFPSEGNSDRGGAIDVKTRISIASDGGSLVVRVFRYFSIISFVCFTLAAVALALLFRVVVVREITAFG